MTRRFRLAAVERLRAARLEETVRALAAARRALAKALATREALAAQLARAVPPVRATPDAAVVAGARREALRARLSDAVRAVAEAEHEIGLAVAAWRGARADLRAVQALHEWHLEALARDDARREQLILDDLAAQTVLGRRARAGTS
jgi:flagellar biosynthesis chaperone FliJ